MGNNAIATTLKKGDQYIYPATYYNQVIMPDGTRWDGTAGSDSVHIGSELPSDTEKQAEVLLWVDEDEPDLTIGYEIYTGPTQPTEESYDLWIDTSAEPITPLPASETMRKDAIKYKTFSIATSAWSGSGPYTYQMTANGITANTAILNLTLDATSQTYQKAQLDWETGANFIKLSTATKPTGTISGYLIATEVTVI